MKIFYKIIIFILIILAIPLIVALFTENEYAVKREITINRPVSEVFDYLKHLKNQEKYSVWNQMDPKMEKYYKGTDGTVGFVSGWKSEVDSVGYGEQEIKNITPNERIDLELRFIKPFEATEPAYFTTQSIDSTTTKVSWGFNGKFNYPMNLFLLFMDMEKQIGKDLDKGLISLKKILESQNTSTHEKLQN